MELSLSSGNDPDSHMSAAIYTPVSCEVESDFENQKRHSMRGIAFNSGTPTRSSCSLTPDLHVKMREMNDSEFELEANLVFEVMREDTRLFSVDMELKSVKYSIQELMNEINSIKNKYFANAIDSVSIKKSESGVTYRIVIRVKKSVSDTVLLTLMTYLVSLTKSVQFAYYILTYFDFLDESNLPSLSILISLCVEELPRSQDSLHFPFLKAVFAILQTFSNRCFSRPDIPSRTFSSFAQFTQQILCLLFTLQTIFYRLHIKIPKTFHDSAMQLLGNYLRHCQEWKKTDKGWILPKLNSSILMCITEFTRSEEFRSSSHHAILCDYLIQLVKDVSFDDESIVFESMIQLTQSQGCRMRLSHQTELDYFFQRLALPTSSLTAVVNIIMIVTALVADNSLEIPFFSLRINPYRMAEGSQNPQFIEAFSQFLLIREARFHVMPIKEESAVIENFFLRYTLLPSMTCTRRLLMRQIHCFPPTLEDAAFLNFAAKLDDSLLSLLFSSSELQVSTSLSIISMFFGNQRFWGFITIPELLKRLVYLLEQYFQNKSIRNSILSLMKHITQIQPHLGCTILTKSLWKRIDNYASLLCESRDLTSICTFLACVKSLVHAHVITTEWVQKSTVCVFADNSNWSSFSRCFLPILLDESQEQVLVDEAIDHYAAVFLIFDKILTRDSALIDQWAELLRITVQRNSLKKACRMLSFFEHLSSNVSLLATLRESKFFEHFIHWLPQCSVPDCGILLDSFYQIVAANDSDPNLKSLFTPSSAILLVKLSQNGLGLISFALFLVFSCLSSWTIESIRLSVDSLFETLFDILELYGARKEDESVRSRVYRICIQLDSMGFHSQLFATCHKRKWLIHSLFRFAFQQFLTPVDQESTEMDEWSRFDSLQRVNSATYAGSLSHSLSGSRSGSFRSSSFHSRRSGSIHSLYMSHQSSSGLGADMLLTEQNQHPVWLLDKEPHKEEEDSFYFRVDHRGGRLDMGKRPMFHYEMAYYVCQCASCVKKMEVDDMDPLVHFIDFVVCILTPQGYESSDEELDVVSLEEIERIKDVVEKMSLSRGFSHMKKLYSNCMTLMEWLDPRRRSEVYFEYEGGPQIIAESKYQSRYAIRTKKVDSTVPTTMLRSSLYPFVSQWWNLDHQVEADPVL